MRVLVTGATGFVGQGLVPALAATGHSVRIAMREPGPLPTGVDAAVIGDLSRPLNRSFVLDGTDAVIHAAGIAHQGPDVPASLYQRVNTDATIEIAKAAARAGVKRFVFLSSIRAQSGPFADEVLTEDMPARPTDNYGRSKLAAEEALRDVGVPFTVLRPVLIHGTGVRYNMASLMALARSPWPLPLGGLTAKRSIVARAHLTDAALLSLTNEAMVGGTFIVADPEPLTVAEMVTAMRKGFGRRPSLMPVPAGLLKAGAAMIGRKEMVERLMGSLIVDPSRLLAAGWLPREGTADALERTSREIQAIRS